MIVRGITRSEAENERLMSWGIVTFKYTHLAWTAIRHCAGGDPTLAR
jgi:hypothetical protein